MLTFVHRDFKLLQAAISRLDKKVLRKSEIFSIQLNNIAGGGKKEEKNLQYQKTYC